MRRWVLGLVVGLTAHLGASAEPMFAARTGLGCASCHINRTGGGGRTTYGASYGGLTLPWKKLAAGHGLFDGAIGERLRLGFDGRGGYVATFRDTGPYIGESTLREADIYLGVDLLKDKLSIYVDEHVAPGGAAAREAFALYAIDRAGFYLKGGKFYLPFGLRFQDDEAATRRTTGFTFETADVGAEVGMDDGKWSSSLSITNGTSGGAETDNGKQYCWIGARVFTLGRFGISASTNVLPQGAHRSVAGAFGTFRSGPIVVLTEADVIREHDGVNPEREGGAGHVEVDGLVHAGLTLRAFIGAGDLDRSDGVERSTQWGVGVDWTPLPGLQIRALYRARDGASSVVGASDDQAWIEAHVYF